LEGEKDEDWPCFKDFKEVKDFLGLYVSVSLDSVEDEKMRIGLSNQKGGVGKTTNAINVAGALATQGHEVLIVDTDPQGYLTKEIGFEEQYTAEPPTLFDALKKPGNHETSDLVVQHEEFAAIPSNVDMHRLEQELVASGRRPRERLNMVLNRLDTEPDFVVVDAPPSMGPINDNVLLATKNVLVPVEADRTSRLALNQLMDQVKSLEEFYETQIDLVGTVISNVQHPLDNEQKQAIQWFLDTFENLCPVFQVRHRVAVRRVLKDGHSLFGNEVHGCDQKQVYAEIARHLEETTNPNE